MKNRKQRKVLLYLLVVLGITVGFALLSTTLKINGNASIKSNTWNIHWNDSSINVTQGSVSATDPIVSTTTSTKDTVSFDVELELPGDFYEFEIDAINEGSIDGELELEENWITYKVEDTSTTLPSYLDFKVVYDDNNTPTTGDVLAHGESKTYKVRVEFKSSVEELPENPEPLTIEVKLPYIQHKGVTSIGVCDDNDNITLLSSNTCSNNENVTIGSGIVCKRAIKLHEEVCNQDSDSLFCSETYTTGSNITYGNCGTAGTLTPGDAFTCDVNGDGNFEELAERFYYISDYYNTTSKTFDNTTAVLVYYNHVKDGVSCNKYSFEYAKLSDVQEVDSSVTYVDSWHGPVTAIKQLPTTAQWKNVNLKNTSRTLLAEYKTTHDSSTIGGGKNLPTNFSYSGYAARLLTAKELMNGCGVTEAGNYTHGELDSCKYLAENLRYANPDLTIYSWWLETVPENYYRGAYNFNGTDRNIMIYEGDSYYGIGVRPAIEIPKTKISY